MVGLILPSQKYSLFKQIQDSGLDISKFEFAEEKTPNHANRGWTINFIPNNYYKFQHYQRAGSNDYLQMTYIAPAEKQSCLAYTHKENAPFELVFEIFIEWTEYLKRELNAIDNWEELLNDINTLRQSIDGKVIPDDIHFIKETVKQIKEEIKNLNLSEPTKEKIIVNLDQSVHYYQKDKSFDWFSYVIGTFTSMLINMTIDKATGTVLLSIVGNTFRKLIGF